MMKLNYQNARNQVSFQTEKNNMLFVIEKDDRVTLLLFSII